jgi:hypothetical protein
VETPTFEFYAPLLIETSMHNIHLYLGEAGKKDCHPVKIEIKRFPGDNVRAISITSVPSICDKTR